MAGKLAICLLACLCLLFLQVFLKFQLQAIIPALPALKLPWIAIHSLLYWLHHGSALHAGVLLLHEASWHVLHLPGGIPICKLVPHKVSKFLRHHQRAGAYVSIYRTLRLMSPNLFYQAQFCTFIESESDRDLLLSRKDMTGPERLAHLLKADK